jgi:hypothetical protein
MGLAMTSTGGALDKVLNARGQFIKAVEHDKGDLEEGESEEIANV